MRGLRKINNNAVICLDSTGQEMIAMGKGIGFGTLPREIPLAQVERTFYNVDERYLGVLRDLPPDVLDFSAQLLDIARNELPYTLSPNAILTLADHIAFTIERARRNIRVKMPLAYDVEQLYPAEYRIGQYAVKRIQKEFQVGLPGAEAVGIAINLLNARVDGDSAPDAAGAGCTDSEMLEDITEMVENHFNLIVQRDSFNYSRLAMHMRYLVQRMSEGSPMPEDSATRELFRSVKMEYPEDYDCTRRIADWLAANRGWHCNSEEQLYLVMHIHRVRVSAQGGQDGD